MHSTLFFTIKCCLDMMLLSQVVIVFYLVLYRNQWSTPMPTLEMMFSLASKSLVIMLFRSWPFKSTHIMLALGIFLDSYLHVFPCFIIVNHMFVINCILPFSYKPCLLIMFLINDCLLLFFFNKNLTIICNDLGTMWQIFLHLAVVVGLQMILNLW